MAKPRSEPQLRLDSAAVYDDMGGIPPDHWCYTFYSDVYCAIDEQEFEGLYQEGGRKPISPRRLACLILLQYKAGLSDRQALDSAMMRRDWRIALGIPADWEGFNPTVLVDFRKRLRGEPVREGQPEPEDKDGAQRVFDMVLERARVLGVLPQTTKVRVDASHVLAHVSRLSRVDMVREAIRVVVCDAYRHHPSLRECSEFMELHERYWEERWLGTGNAKQAEEELVSLGLAGRALLDLCGALEVKGKDVLAQILEENFVWAEDTSPEPLPAKDRPQDRIVSPHDPDARSGKKRDMVWTGDKAHVLETAADDAQNLIVGVLCTGPRVEDGQMLPEIMGRAREVLPDVDTIIADSGYASAQNSKRAASDQIELVAPPRPDSSTNGIRASEFEIDCARQVARCPEGKESRVWSEKEDEITIRFSPTDCRACPRREECTKSKQGRTLGLHKEHEQLARDRRRAQEPEFKDLYRRRAAIEGTFSHLVHTAGFRRSRYRSAAGRALHATLSCAALNMWRVVSCVTGRENGPKRAQCGTRMPVGTPVGA